MTGVLWPTIGCACAAFASLVATADDERSVILLDEDIVFHPVGADAAPDSSERYIGDRIVNGRANIILIGDSIIDTDMSAAYIAAFRPRHGYRGYATSGAVSGNSAWRAYTNARTTWSWEAINELDGMVAHIGTSTFIEDDFPDEATGDPGSAWEAYAAPCNIRRLVANGDLPDGLELCSLGSSWFYEHILADQTFLTEPGARLRTRILWFDHPTAMGFTVQARSTVLPEDGGSTDLFDVPVAQTEGLTPRWMELPQEILLGDAPRDLGRRTEIVVTPTMGRVEQPGESFLIGGVRVYNDARKNGIQWGWASAGGAQAREHTLVPIDAWRAYIEFQQSDTYVMQLGVNDLFNGENSGLIAGAYIDQLIERIHEAHLQAQANDPEIRDPVFLLVSSWDSHNPHSGPWLDNQEWQLLALSQRWIAERREDTAFIDLRAMVEEENGQWWYWRNTHLRDRIHPRGPYWHEDGSWWEEEPYPDGAMYFAGLVWDKLVDFAPEFDEGLPGPPPCACRADLTCDGTVDGADLAGLLAAWGNHVPPNLDMGADLDGDGLVDGADLAVLLAAWGTCQDQGP